MLSKKGKYLLFVIMITTTQLIYGQQNELGLLANVGVSKFHKTRSLGGLERQLGKLTPQYSECFESGMYYRKTFRNNTFIKIEVSYNRLRGKHTIRNQRIKELEVISRNPYEFRWIDVGEVKRAKEVRNHNAINFPGFIGINYRKFFFEIGYGGSLIWETDRSIYINEVIKGEEKIDKTKTRRKGYSFVQRLYRVNLGYEVSDKMILKLNGYRAVENDDPQKYYTEYSIGLEYRLLKRKARW